MSEFQMAHVALVGARINAFAPLGISSRTELTMSLALPPVESGHFLYSDTGALKERLIAYLPFWVHNCIYDPGFPARQRLAMHLRKFEGELRDNRSNEVIATVLSYGFRDRQMDPMALPETMPLRQRCSMLMHLGPWQEAYRELELQFMTILTSEAEQLELWLAKARSELDHAIAI
ncbi:MAG: hypothetical protein ABJN62_08365 [Halioglobus sp.]